MITSRSYRRIAMTACIVTAVLLPRCGGPLRIRTCHTAAAANQQPAYVLTGPACRDWFAATLLAFGDSVSDSALESLWNRFHAPSPTDTSLDNLAHVLPLFERLSFTVAAVRPDTWEALHAMAAFPSAPFLLTIRFAHKAVTPLERNALLAAGAGLDSVAGRIRLQHIALLELNGREYRLQTDDGDVLTGVSTDLLTGSVYPVKNADGSEG